MSGFFGADVGQLRDLGTQLGHQSDFLRVLSARLTAQVDAVEWHGPDAQRFRAEWSSRLAVDLVRVSAGLANASQGALLNAAQQEQVSAGASSPSRETRAGEQVTSPPAERQRSGESPTPAPAGGGPQARLDPSEFAQDAAYREGRDYFMIDGNITRVVHNREDPSLTFVEVDGRRIYRGDHDWPPQPSPGASVGSRMDKTESS